MNVLLLILLLAVAAFSIFGGIVVLSRDYRKIENLGFFGMALGVGGWAAGIAGFLGSSSADAALLWAKTYYVAPILIVVSAIYFAEYFTTRKFSNAFVNGLITFGGLALVAFLLGYESFLTDSVIISEAGNQVQLNKAQYAVYSAYLTFCFIMSIGILMLKKRSVKQIVSKQQLNIYLFGYATSTVLGVYFNLLLPALGNYKLIMIGPLMSAFWLGATAYAIVKHQLFDIRSFVVRSTAYTFTSLTLGVLYVAPAIYLMGIVIMGFPFIWYKFIIATIAGIVVAANYARLKAWFDNQTRRVFFRDSYDTAQLLGRLNRQLVETTDLRKMLLESADLITTNLKVDFCVYAIKDRESGAYRLIGNGGKKLTPKTLDMFDKLLTPLKQQIIVTDYLDYDYSKQKAQLAGFDVAAMIRLAGDKQDKLGFMVIGYKKSGNVINSQDQHTLEAIADVIVIAIQNALLYEEIQKFNITLQNRIEEATRKMRRTNAKLEALDETKDDFISMASHQLRTPLTSVKGYLSMVLEGDAGKLTTMQRKMLDQAFVSSQRMVFLIADLLNISRLKTGKFVIEPVPLDLSMMVSEEVKQLQETAKNRSLELQYDKPEDFPTLMLDETKTRQVIMNFIDNAIYYTPAGGTIRVRLVDRPDAIELRVEDNGIGVPKGEQPHLFTKFYRAGNARRARPDGTGLGLFMAKKVIIAQGGAVIFDSKEGKGSTFGFALSKAKALAK